MNYDYAAYQQTAVPNYAPMEFLPVRGAGSKLWDADGKEYLDFGAGIAVCSLGHSPPELREALRGQADKIWHLSNLFINAPAIELAQRLCQSTFADRVFLANSGSEAVEAALKLARRYSLAHEPRKQNIIAFENAFHGRTFFSVCVGGQPKYSDGFGDKPGGITHLPFNDIGALEGAVNGDTCAVILEPIQGEGGVVPAAVEFVKRARELCDQHRALLIFDEVQTGVGRSGYLYLYQKLGITPDILTSAKGLGGGFPVSAMLATDEVARSLSVGTHGSTFGGNPLAAAVANRVLQVVNEPAFLAAVKAKSAQLKIGLDEINARRDVFTEVRGEGLLLGAELKPPLRAKARDIIKSCGQNGLLILMAGPNVLRFAPALNISEAEISHGLCLLETAIAKMP